MSFITKYEKARDKKKSVLCVGLDPAIPGQRKDNTIDKKFLKDKTTGEALLDSAIALKTMDEFRRLQGDAAGADGITPLTERELDILRLVAQGLDNSEIGHQLGLSEKTIRNRLTTIFEKLHVNNRIQAALYALREGLASLNGEDS